MRRICERTLAVLAERRATATCPSCGMPDATKGQFFCRQCQARFGKALRRLGTRAGRGGLGLCSICKWPKGHSRSSRLCLACLAAYSRLFRRRHSELSEEARRKANARSYAGSALRRGKIVRKAKCEQCGGQNPQMHHRDYSKPLEVEWLCRPCHLAEHYRVPA